MDREVSHGSREMINVNHIFHDTSQYITSSKSSITCNVIRSIRVARKLYTESAVDRLHYKQDWSIGIYRTSVDVKHNEHLYRAFLPLRNVRTIENILMDVDRIAKIS